MKNPQWSVDCLCPYIVKAIVFLSCALLQAQTPNVIVWGNSAYTNVPPSATNVVAAAAGRTFDIALRSDGQVVLWGPQTNYPDLKVANAIAVAAGDDNAAVLLNDGSVAVWESVTSGLRGGGCRRPRRTWYELRPAPAIRWL